MKLRAPVCRRRLAAPLSLAALLLLGAIGAQASDLAAFVPDDVGMTIEGAELYPAANRFLDSELYRRLSAVPALQKLLQSNLDRPRAVGNLLAAELGMSIDEFGNQLLGKQALLGVWPGKLDDVDPSRMLVLVETQDARFAARVTAKLNESFETALPGSTKKRDCAGLTYTLARVADGDKMFEVAFATVGVVNMLSGNEAILRKALELGAKQAQGFASLQESPSYAKAIARLKSDATVKIFVNPRPWDPTILKRLDPPKNKKTPDEELLVRRAASQAWQAAEYWAMSADLEPHFSLESFMHFDPETAPLQVRELGQMFSGKAEFLQHIPGDAALAFAGRIDLAHFAAMLYDSPQAERMENLDQVREMSRGLFMGLDLFDDVIARLGPDVGFYMAPLDDAPREDGKKSPVEWVGAARMPRKPYAQGEPDLEAALDSGLRTAMMLSASVENADQDEPVAQVVDSHKNGVKLTSLEGVEKLPSGLVATYGFADGFLFGGTTASAVGRCLGVAPQDSLANNPDYKRLANERLDEPGQVLFMNCRALRKILTTNPKFIVDFISNLRNRPRAEVEESLAIVTQLTELGETIVFASKIEDSGLAFSLDVSVEEPAIVRRAAAERK